MVNITGKLTRNSTRGEKKLYSHLLAWDAPEVSCYYEPIVQDDHPDFVLVGADIGVVVVEVKDYRAEALVGVSASDDWEYCPSSTSSLVTTVTNPLIQIYNYWKSFARKLRLHSQDLPFNQLFRLVIVFSHVGRETPAGVNIRAVNPSRVHLIFQDDLNQPRITFLSQFEQIVDQQLQLKPLDVELLAANINPVLRLPQYSQKRFTEFLTPEDDVRLLDEQQAKMAVELGEGHRIIYGVAGSGKTILLVARARFLSAKHPDWRILILCYNVLLRDYLTKLLNPLSLTADVEVENYHRWSRSIIFGAGTDFKNKYTSLQDQCQTSDALGEFFQTQVPQLLTEAIQHCSGGKYDAILVDEAQDFEQGWFFPIIQLLNKRSNSLLVCLDGLQGIYARKKFHWSDVGIKARGRSKKLRKSYRNPMSIGKFAFEFLTRDQRLQELVENDEDYLSPEEYARKGGMVVFEESTNQSEEFQNIHYYLEKFGRQKWRVIVLFYRNLAKDHFDHPFIDYLKAHNIPWKGLGESRPDRPGVYIGTLHGTKGLEAEAVIIPEVGLLPSKPAVRQLLYVGMTRAIHCLLLSSSRANYWTDELRQLSLRK